jgi:SAM-dependent methyltransferase
MSDGRERRLVFGEVADLYERARPGYPSAAFDHVVAVAGLQPGSRVLEVGCGTGKATTALAERGLAVLALEPHPAMARIAEDKTRGTSVRILTTAFESWEPEETSFELVLAAQAWHWIDPEFGFRRAAALLRPSGWLALLWNWPTHQEEPVRRRLDDVYRRLAPDMESQKVGPEFVPEWAEAIATSGHFGRVEHRDFPWSRTYTTDDYTTLLQTHSNHRLLPEVRRGALLEEVAAAIDDNGGTFTIDYVCTVFLAPKPG